MRRILSLIICITLSLLFGCDVHEWPETPNLVEMNLNLNYETEMTEWEFLHNETTVTEQGYGDTYNNHQQYGMIRYIVRTYPVSDKQRTMQNYTQEFIFLKDIAEGYDHKVSLKLLPGNYDIMVWSDLVESDNNKRFYNADSFDEIMLHGEHKGNTNYRDAYYGKYRILVSANKAYQINKAIDININMKRPLAKFQVIANDLPEFIDAQGNTLSRYKAKIQYVGYMPNTYSMFADRPVASIIGEKFESQLSKITETEVSIGFDYVFVSDQGSSVTVKLSIYDNKDQLISFSEPITIPVKQDHHTLLKGKFLTQNATKGVDIDPNWGGDYNIVL